jgi:hypothetical protein
MVSTYSTWFFGYFTNPGAARCPSGVGGVL